MESETELTAVRQHMRSVKPPSHYDKVNHLSSRQPPTPQPAA